MILLSRNLYGFWIVLSTGAVCGALTWFLPSRYFSLLVAFAAGFFMIGALRAALTLFRRAKMTVGGKPAMSDADILKRNTRVPAFFYKVFFLLAVLGCLLLAVLMVRSWYTGAV